LNDIAVIVLNWNGYNDTIECVESLLEQSLQDFTLFLIDNYSENNEFEKLKLRYNNDNRIILRKNNDNLGFTLAHNKIFQELQEKKFNYAVLLNNDAVADPNWLYNLVTTAKKEKADMVGCLMLKYDNHNKIDNRGLFLLSSGEILPLGHNSDIDSLPKKIKIIAPSGGACLYSISMLNEIKLFDPYFSTGYEDAELGLRAFLAGKKISFAPNAIVYHKMSQSVAKVFNRRKAQKIQEDINYTYIKLMPATVIFINALTNIPRWIIIMLVHVFTLRFRFVAVQMGALLKSVNELGLILSKRKEFKKIRKRNTLSILKTQTFFLCYDLKRFKTLILSNQKNQFEKY
jgi:GT2 family glycosyltransferase